MDEEIQNGEQQKIPTILDGLEECPLHKNTPFGIRNVSMSQFSIARHSGGMNFNNNHYTYWKETDELIRTDVLKWKKQQEKMTKAQAKPKPKSKHVQHDLPLNKPKR